jgi:alpha-methylacyl-CoA racemase
LFGKPRGENMLDSGTHWYETYKTKDEKFMAVGALEPQFYAVLLEKLEVSDDELPQWGEADEMKEKLANIFSTKTQAEWCSVFDGTDACVTPILEQTEAPHHPHNSARGSFLANGEPKPAPKLSRTPPIASGEHPVHGQHTRDVLREIGYSEQQIEDLLKNKVTESND